MRSFITTAFTQHPNSVGESYFQHLCTALGFGARMFLAGGACFLHALFPFIYVKTGSRLIAELNEKMLLQRDQSKIKHQSSNAKAS